jgi:hypothetical protein
MNRTPTKPNRWRPITVFNLLVGLLFSPLLTSLAQNSSGGYPPIVRNPNYPNSQLSHKLGSSTDLFDISQGVVLTQSAGDWSSYPMRDAIGGSSGSNESGTAIVGSPSFFEIKLPSQRRIGLIRLYTLSKNLQNNDRPLASFTVKYYSNNQLENCLTDSTLVSKRVKSPSDTYDNSNEIIGCEVFDYPVNITADRIRFEFTGSGPRVMEIDGFEYINSGPRIAASSAQVVNGFVVGATITDGGYGYVENPNVIITGGGGTGAKATAFQVNGVVASIIITNPGSGYTSAPNITIAPPPFPPRKATSTIQIVNGFVVDAKITDGGFGYDSPPAVLVVGGGGSGATAVATVANGVITAITISNPGTGYTSPPVVRIASPPFAPKLGIETSKVFVRMSVVLGRKYQLEASTDLNSWTTTGPAFIAQDEELAQEFDVNQVGQYFRINQVP